MIAELLNKILHRRDNTKMRLSHIIERVYLKPMLITESGHHAIRKVIEAKLNTDTLLKKLEDKPEVDTDMFGDAIKTPYDLADGVRVIPITGICGYRVSALERVCGICDISMVNEWTREAANDENVKTILYDISSPGGEVTGIPELAELIEAVGKVKNTIAFTDTLACSAAWWIFCSCNETYHTKSAELLSIGVYSYILDYTENFAKEGIKVEAFISGDLKGIGIPGVSLTDAQRQYMKGESEELGILFRDYCRKRTPNITDAEMRGQTKNGLYVAGKGITTGIVSRMEDIFGE